MFSKKKPVEASEHNKFIIYNFLSKYYKNAN